MSFGELQKTFVSEGRKPNQIVAPTEISHEMYMKIYSQTC